VRTEKPVNNQFVCCAVIAVSVSTVIWFFEKALAFTFERRRNSAGSRQRYSKKYTTLSLGYGCCENLSHVLSCLQMKRISPLRIFSMVKFLPRNTQAGPEWCNTFKFTCKTKWQSKAGKVSTLLVLSSDFAIKIQL